jgi:hypothetical protein
MRSIERKEGIVPAACMGGFKGITSCSIMSFNLGNEAHFDPNDGDHCISFWIEKDYGKGMMAASNWYLVFPNMAVRHMDKDGGEPAF